MNHRAIWKSGVMAVLLLAVLLLGACAPKSRAPQSMLDTPLHHYKTGMRLFDAGKVERAAATFNEALSLAPDYGPALAGKGLVLVAQQQGERGLEFIEDGQSEADDASGQPERLWTYVAEIRASSMLFAQQQMDAQDLMKKADSTFAKAQRSLEPDDSRVAMAWYWLGEAQVQALLFDEAQASFEQARMLDGGYAAMASARLEFLGLVREAALVTSLGKRIALVDTITRADMAALLVEELGVQRFFEATAPELQHTGSETFVPPVYTLQPFVNGNFDGTSDNAASDTAGSTADIATSGTAGAAGNAPAGDMPVTEEADGSADAPEDGTPAATAFPAASPAHMLASDIAPHPLREDIISVLEFEVRGLEVFADGTFQPERPLTRAEAALIAEDIYVRARNDNSMATRYVGTVSPFSDVRGDHPYFNAVMFATARGIFHADVARGRFDPFGPVSGADAVMMIHILRTRLDIF